ncbi:hypothetical protein ABZW30_45880 [Kitasatospora sp. NPDC004669]|uniref:hypothetical protein n=1 Tax=Kitasatospora sp. NPDC004669 TaxID=3154555 RepID=UPI00339ECD4C
MTTTDPPTDRPVPEALPDPSALLRGTNWASLETATGPARKLPQALIRLLEPDLTMPEARKALDALEPVRHQNTIYDATPATALFVAALLARRTTQHGMEANGVCMLLLAWLAGVATDSDDACVAAGNRYFDGNYLDGYPAMVAMRALRPVLYRAVSPFLDNADAAVRDTALAAALAFAEHPALAPHRDNLIHHARQLLLTNDTQWRRQQALDALRAWGHDTTGLTRPGDDDRSPYTSDSLWPDGDFATPPF